MKFDDREEPTPVAPLVLSASALADIVGRGRPGYESICNIDGVLTQVDARGNVTYPAAQADDTSGAPGDEARRAREALTDELVGNFAGGIAVLRTDRGPSAPARNLTDDDCWERARNLVAALLGEYNVTRKDNR